MQTLKQILLQEIATLTDEQIQSVITFIRHLKLGQDKLDLLQQQVEVRAYRPGQ